MVEFIKECEIYAVIVAGGKGLRMKSGIPKQYIKIAGIPVLSRTISQFENFESICKIVVVIPEQDTTYCLENIILPCRCKERILTISGGTERQQSVMNGLKIVKEVAYSKKKSQNNTISYKLPNNSDYIQSDSPIRSINTEKQKKIVLIHDGVRPFVDNEIIIRCIKGAFEHDACIPVVPVSDTLKLKDKNGFVAGLVDRTNLYKVQTPQAFNLDLIIKAHENAIISGLSATDDASLVEQMGKKVFMTLGSERNIKITTQEDLIYAEYLSSTLNG